MTAVPDVDAVPEDVPKNVLTQLQRQMHEAIVKREDAKQELISAVANFSMASRRFNYVTIIKRSAEYLLTLKTKVVETKKALDDMRQKYVSQNEQVNKLGKQLHDIVTHILKSVSGPISREIAPCVNDAIAASRQILTERKDEISQELLITISDMHGAMETGDQRKALENLLKLISYTTMSTEKFNEGFDEMLQVTMSL